MSNEEFSSIWDAIEDTPAAAETMKMRSSLMIDLQKHVDARGLDPAQAARCLGVTEPRMAELMDGKINAFPLESLIAMASAAGLQVELRLANREAA